MSHVNQGYPQDAAYPPNHGQPSRPQQPVAYPPPPQHAMYPPAQQQGAYPPPQQQGPYPPPQQPPPPGYGQPRPPPYGNSGQPMVYTQAHGLTPAPAPPTNRSQGSRGNHQGRGGRGKAGGLSMFNSDWAGTSFSDKKIRSAFIRKVYLILMFQLSITVAFICWFIFHEPTKRFIQEHSYLYYISYAIFIATFIALYCCPTVRRKTPGNYICLIIFTLAMSYMCAAASSYHDTYIVLACMAITVVVCSLITLFVMQNKIDFTGGCCTAVLIVLVIVLVITFIASLVVWLTVGGNYWLSILLGGIAALIMCLMLAIDTHMIMGNGKNKLSPEEYIVAALDLYLDIVYLFMIILCLSGAVGD